MFMSFVRNYHFLVIIIFCLGINGDGFLVEMKFKQILRRRKSNTLVNYISAGEIQNLSNMCLDININGKVVNLLSAL